VGCLTAFETINTNSTLFSPPYGRGRAAAGVGGNVGNHGVGLWPVGRHRWFFRGLLYGVLASTSPLHVQHSEILPSALIQGGLVYSGESRRSFSVSVLLYVHRDRTDRTGRGAQDDHLDYHTAPELCEPMQSFFFFFLSPQWGTADAEIKVSLCRAPELTSVLCLKPGVG